MTFNTYIKIIINVYYIFVLNLVINGWPSIHRTWKRSQWKNSKSVLNLVINGWPSIPKQEKLFEIVKMVVLNLVINGWPSIRRI